MSLTKTFTILSGNDARIITRDSFMIAMTAYVIGITVVARYAVPWLNETLAAQEGIGFSLVDYYPLIVAYIAVFNGSLLGGMIIGFLLLEERESNTMTALLVTPISMPVYLLYRVLVPALVGFVLVFVQLMLLGNLAPLPMWQMALVATGSGLTAAIAALFFATFAENRVQGFALMKITGIAGFVIIGAWFVAAPLQYLFGLFPPYWVSKAYWLAVDGNALWPLFLLVGFVLQILFCGLMVYHFNRTIYRNA
ncbi:MAG: hypothetical protein AAF653_15520 [Chloroflexota bacterium]